jgi:hypothetical protein
MTCSMSMRNFVETGWKLKKLKHVSALACIFSGVPREGHILVNCFESRKQITRQTLRLWTFKPTPNSHLGNQIKEVLLVRSSFRVVCGQTRCRYKYLVARLIHRHQSLERQTMGQMGQLMSLPSFLVKTANSSLPRPLYKSSHVYVWCRLHSMWNECAHPCAHAPFEFGDCTECLLL